MKTTIKILVVLTLMLTLMLPGVGTVHAASITVTTTVDELNADGDCSLREAIQAATTDTAVDACVAGSGADTITVPAGTYNLTIGDLDLIDVTINGTGAGSTIIKQTNPNFRVIEVLGTVNISRVTIQDGRAADSNIVPTHLHGSGLHNHGTVTLTNVTFTGNTVANLNPANPTSGRGGAIWNAGSMTLINVTIANNTAAVSGAGIGGNAPTIINTIVANNSPDNCSVAIAAGSGNLQFPGTTCGATIPMADPLLGPLTSGVYPLLAGSPAIDTGTNTGCPPTDELGTARPQGAACDIGAFEFVPPPPPTAPTCNGQTATIYVNSSGIIVGGPNNGQTYAGKLNGTAGADVMVGTSGRDEFSARGGNDLLCGGGNNDEMEGGGGRDTIIGEGGNDILAGEGGNDTLTGGPGADRFRGGEGTDTATDFTPAQGDIKFGVENF
jgi:CSLREA domain-containing protein